MSDWAEGKALRGRNLSAAPVARTETPGANLPVFSFGWCRFGTGTMRKIPGSGAEPQLRLIRFELSSRADENSVTANLLSELPGGMMTG